MPAKKSHRQKWFEMRLGLNGQRHYLGAWLTEEDALIARDRARLHFGIEELSVPELSRRFGPASPAELIREAKLKSRAALADSQYFGVNKAQGGEGWIVSTQAPGGGMIHVGGFRTARAAAFAYDRIARFIGKNPDDLNFPGEDLKPAAPDEIRREVRQERKRSASSAFFGVTFAAMRDGWQASIRHEGKTVSLGTYDDEHIAAKAHDRALLHFELPKTGLNFPGRSVRPASPEQLREEALKLQRQKYVSRFRGVARDVARSRWQVHIEWDGQQQTVASFHDEKAAARAYDRMARYFQRPASRLNFPGEDNPAASPEQIREEVRAAFKSTTTSQYRGVHWMKSSKAWGARIAHEGTSHFLGLHASEEEAARAYDKQAKRLHGAKAKLNFD